MFCPYSVNQHSGLDVICIEAKQDRTSLFFSALLKGYLLRFLDGLDWTLDPGSLEGRDGGLE